MCTVSFEIMYIMHNDMRLQPCLCAYIDIHLIYRIYVHTHVLHPGFLGAIRLPSARRSEESTWAWMNEEIRFNPLTCGLPCDLTIKQNIELSSSKELSCQSSTLDHGVSSFLSADSSTAQ